ncbi:MAG: lysine--tRNA ligase, partial [Turneriella sp.]|nr:lysine--tRNA ligase [Turneriella sp.]
PYIAGREMGNAFSELNDPFEQEERFREQLRQKEQGAEETMATDDDFITALKVGMPPTGGLGLGIDRMAMLFTNKSSIKDVILFPLLRPKQNP